MGTSYNVAVVGATGAVGRQLVESLAERDFPVGELRLFATAASAGEAVDFRGEELMLQPLERESFRGIDFAFFCAGEGPSREFCPLASAAGAVAIDLSGAWRLDPEVPLVVPEVNPEELSRAAGKGIIAVPASATIALALAIKPLDDDAGVRRLVVATYQGVSGCGRKAIDELRIQTGELLNGRPSDPRVFPHQIAFNCLPQVGDFLPGGTTGGEAALIAETRKVLAASELQLSVTAVQVPVFYGDGAAVNLETARALDPDRARALLAAAAGVELVDDPGALLYPTPVAAAGQDLVCVGRLRRDESVAHGLNLWLAIDNLRKGAATTALQIAERLTSLPR